MIYPPGFHWAVDMKPNVGTELCMHAHVGFLARGEIHIEYADGCIVEHKAPQVVAIDPGHDGWVVGKEPVILIEFDFEGDTVNRLGMPAQPPHHGGRVQKVRPHLISLHREGRAFDLGLREAPRGNDARL
jgi:hypothetical protein